jgi:hypothetical protein
MTKYKVAITGATGFIGKSLAIALKEHGHLPVAISRSDIGAGAPYLTEKLRGVGVVINLAGAPIIAPWSESYKKELYYSRVNTTSELVKAFEKMDVKPSLLISASAVGYYASGRKHNEETFTHATDFLGALTDAWERAALKASSIGVRTVVFRFGVVLGKTGGVIAKISLPFKLGLGGVVGNGSQAFSWIQIRDLENAFLTAIDDNSFSEVYNLTAPIPTTNREFTVALAKALNRPAFIPIPEFVLQMIFGEGADVLTKGQSVYPKRLLDAKFGFLFPDIESAVKESLYPQAKAD